MSIHIKPENRGKFNATKKRTGKTTEQLTHSKNPLTRKRAIFAQNAKKWHHAYGGNLFYDGGPDGDPTYNLGYLPEITVTPNDIINVGTKDVPIHKQRKSRSQEELNKDYLNQLITYNSNNPGGIWGDNKDAEAARKWMFKHHPAIIEGWYNNLSAKDKKNIPTKMLSQNLVKNNYMQDFGKRRDDLSKGVLQTIGGITGAGLAAGTSPVWGPAAWSAAQPWLQAAGSPLSTLAGNFAPGLQGAAGLGDLALDSYLTADAVRNIAKGSKNPLDYIQLTGPTMAAAGALKRAKNLQEAGKMLEKESIGKKSFSERTRQILDDLGYKNIDASNMPSRQVDDIEDFVSYGTTKAATSAKPVYNKKEGTIEWASRSDNNPTQISISEALSNGDIQIKPGTTRDIVTSAGEFSPAASWGTNAKNFGPRGFNFQLKAPETTPGNSLFEAIMSSIPTEHVSRAVLRPPKFVTPYRHFSVADIDFLKKTKPEIAAKLFDETLTPEELAEFMKQALASTRPGTYVSGDIGEFPYAIQAMRGYDTSLDLKRIMGQQIDTPDVKAAVKKGVDNLLGKDYSVLNLNLGQLSPASYKLLHTTGRRSQAAGTGKLRYSPQYDIGFNDMADGVGDYADITKAMGEYKSKMFSPTATATEKQKAAENFLEQFNEFARKTVRGQEGILIEGPTTINPINPITLDNLVIFPHPTVYKTLPVKKAKGGNLFNWGGGTLTGRHMDYGMEWNNKIDRLRAYNKMISQTGQQISSAVDSAKGMGNMGSEMSSVTGTVPKTENTSFTNFNPNTWDGKTLTDGKTWNWQTQSYQANPNEIKWNQGNTFVPDFRFQGTQTTPTNTTLNLNMGTYKPTNPYATPSWAKKAYGGNIGIGVNNEKYATRPRQSDIDGVAHLVDALGIKQITQDAQQNMQNMQGMMSSAQGAQQFFGNGNMQNFGEMFKNFGQSFGQGFGGAGAAMACGGKLHCGGGKLFDYGGDFSNGQTMYNTGGTHEENPYEGVQVGTDNQGTPNLVEEGEVRYQDYIFSNRLSLDKEMAKKYNIPKKYADATFAYIAEKMGQESKEREYDPVSQRGLRADMEKLRGAQEEVKALKEQQEMMQQVQQIADELGVAPEDVLTAMQMQQEDQQQQVSPEEQMMMQQQEEIPQEEVSEEEMQEMPYALGGTLFDYQGMDFSTPQRTNKLNESFPNKFGGGGDTHRLLTSKLTEQQLWNKYTKESLNNIVKEFEARYNAAKTPEEQAQIRAQFIQQFNAIQESYARMYQNGVDPRVANDIVKKHQTDFNTFGGNFGYRNIENDLNNNGRTILKDTTEAGFTPDGYRQIITDTRHLGTTAYDKELADYYKELNERLNKSGISYGLLDRDSMRYNGNQLYGLSEYNPTATAAASTKIKRPEPIPDLTGKVPNPSSGPITQQTPPKTRIDNEIEKIGTTTNNKNPQSPAQGVGGQPNGYNTASNNSLMDFVPLWQYLTAGSPDYSQADALVDYTNRMPKTTYKPIGDFMQYHPFDRQYAANQQRARTEAQIRNNWNTSGGNRGYAGAMNLATNMQAQLADAAMQRQADEANLAQRMQVTNFNRDTNKFNAEAFNRVQLQRPYEYQLGLQARAQRAAMHNAIDAAYSAAKSTNLNTFLNNMYNRRREAQDAARTKWMIDAGIFGDVSDPGYPYPINGNSYLDWYNIPWNRFARRTKKDTNE